MIVGVVAAGGAAAGSLFSDNGFGSSVGDCYLAVGGCVTAVRPAAFPVCFLIPLIVGLVGRSVVSYFLAVVLLVCLPMCVC